MYISWTTWNLIAAIFLTLLYLFAFRMMKWWETEVTRVPLRNTRVALVTFGGLPLLAYLLGSIACTLSDPIAVARVAFIYMAVLLPASLFFFAAGLANYIYTFVTLHRFTNMSVLLLSASVIVFLIGLISEQITSLMYRRH